MSKRIYVGNLPSNATEKEVVAMFAKYGSVNSVSIRGGIATIEMASDRAAGQAIQALHQTEMGGRTIKIETR